MLSSRLRSVALTATALLVCGIIPSESLYAQSSFYWPKQGRPQTPQSAEYSVEKVTIPNGDAMLAGWILHPKRGELAGTVLYCHGNAGNMEHHVAFVDFLPRHGYRVLMFDYQGYGESTPNEPTRESTVSDVNAAVDFATKRWGKPWLMGQSLGAALAIAVAGDRPTDLRGVIAVAPFTSYGAAARTVLRRNLLTRTLVLPSYVVVSRGHDPIDAVAKISPTPILIAHGDKDDLIPPRMSRELFDKARAPKDLLIVPGAGHNSGWKEMGPEYVEKVLEFLRGQVPAKSLRPAHHNSNGKVVSRSTPSAVTR